MLLFGSQQTPICLHEYLSTAYFDIDSGAKYSLQIDGLTNHRFLTLIMKKENDDYEKVY